VEVVVSAANVSEAGAKLLLEDQANFLKIFADGGYDGKDFMASVKEDYQLDWSRQAQRPGFGLALAVDSRNNSRAC